MLCLLQGKEKQLSQSLNQLEKDLRRFKTLLGVAPSTPSPDEHTGKVYIVHLRAICTCTIHFLAAISMNSTGSRSNSLEADPRQGSFKREGDGVGEGDHSSRRRHQTTLAVISLDTTPGNTDVEDGGGADQVRNPLRYI